MLLLSLRIDFGFSIRDTLLLDFIIKNNLSFALTEQPETKALLTFLSTTTKQISRRTLLVDLKRRYEAQESKKKELLQAYIATGGRISLITDA